MITLHRLGHADDAFQLNSDLIVTVEATPDTVVTLATAAKVIVSETPDQVAACMRTWQAEVLAQALARREAAEGDVMRLTGRPRLTAAVS
jgi:flagellar protein FlbD